MDIDSRPLTALKGIGPAAAKKLERLGLHTVQDVLFHLPFRYQDRTRITPIGALAPGREAVIDGRIELSEVAFGRRRSLLARVADGTGAVTLRFFHFTAQQQANLARGRRIRCFGEVRRGATTLELVHPEYTAYGGDTMPVDTRLTPIYPTTQGVHQLTLRKAVEQALAHHLAGLHEWLPADVLADLKLPTLQEALAYVHQPPRAAPLEVLEQGRHPTQRRLAFEELLAHHLSLRRLRAAQQEHAAPAMSGPGELVSALVQSLPFALTGAQQRVLDEIVSDLRKPAPMLRLVQGDVGSGKTVVAAVAAMYVLEAGYQVAVMAPTEILADQHYRNFQRWLGPLGVEVAWLAGSLTARARRAAAAAVASGAARLAVGTHALFQEAVAFDNLGLVVVDEQHRFGVHQRLALREKGSRDGRHPHQLIMTATPIPRTLAMTFYADLDVSTIDELPPGRAPVETAVVPDTRRDEVVQRVRDACRAGRQAYWVCPLIEESESLQLQTAVDTAAALREVLPEFSIDLVHGRLKPAAKEAAMARFKDGATDLLVATTVIEVGVDVPNASLMIIEHSERLGLSQLHQLRGRIGRGAHAGSCVLLYHAPLSEAARERLGVLRATRDGFEIARKDLEMRGPGELLGTRQAGLPQWRIANLARDQDLLPRVERAAHALLAQYPANVGALIRRWLGHAESYGNV